MYPHIANVHNGIPRKEYIANPTVGMQSLQSFILHPYLSINLGGVSFRATLVICNNTRLNKLATHANFSKGRFSLPFNNNLCWRQTRLLGSAGAPLLVFLLLLLADVWTMWSRDYILISRSIRQTSRWRQVLEIWYSLSLAYIRTVRNGLAIGVFLGYYLAIVWGPAPDSSSCSCSPLLDATTKVPIHYTCTEQPWRASCVNLMISAILTISRNSVLVDGWKEAGVLHIGVRNRYIGWGG